MSNLKPCPFCGGEAHIKAYPKWDEKQGIVYGAMIDHKNCSDGMETGLFFINGEKTEEQARETLTRAWNTRTETDADRIKEASADRITQRNSLGRVVLKEEFLCERCNEEHWSLGEITDRLAYFEENKTEAEQKIEKVRAACESELKRLDNLIPDSEDVMRHTITQQERYQYILEILEGGK